MRLTRFFASVVASILAVAIFGEAFAHGARSNARKAAEAGFARAGYDGSISVRDIKTGRFVVSVSIGAGAGTLPLSASKLFLVASFLDHRAELPPVPDIDPRALIAFGSDNDGKRLALILRHALGSKVLLADLAHFGIDHCATPSDTDCTTLSSETPDEEWAVAMSIGEVDFRISPSGLSRFLMACANDGWEIDAGLMREATARTLREGMLDGVRIGSASAIKDRLARIGAIGGKTGTGPGPTIDPPTDGMFAGLIFDRNNAPRYSFVTWVRRGGRGGGLAAKISAEVAAKLLGERL